MQVDLNPTVPPRLEKLLVARVNCKNCAPVGLVEGGDYTVAVAACVSQSNNHGRITICCINLTDQPLLLPAGTPVGSYVTIEEAHAQILTNSKEGWKERFGPVPNHMKNLWKGRRTRCQDCSQEEALKDMMTKYGDVFNIH